MGLAGLSGVDDFSTLRGLLEESGYPDVKGEINSLRTLHKTACTRVMRALPVAVGAMRLQEAGVAGIFSKIGKALAKISPSHQLLKKVAPKALAFSPSQIALTAMSAKKPKPGAEALAAKAAKKQAKKDAKAVKKAAKAAKALAKAGAQNLSPVAAGAAVLADQAGLQLATPEAQQFAESAVQSAGGGSGGGMSPMPVDSGAEAGGGESAPAEIFGLPWPVAAGIGAAGLGVLWLAFGGRKR